MDIELQVKVRKVIWTLIFSNRHPMLPRNYWGRCNPAENKMAVRKSLHGVHAIDTVIHEFTHAYFADLGEDAVDEFATELAEVLKRCKMVDVQWSVKELDGEQEVL